MPRLAPCQLLDGHLAQRSSSFWGWTLASEAYPANSACDFSSCHSSQRTLPGRLQNLNVKAHYLKFPHLVKNTPLNINMLVKLEFEWLLGKDGHPCYIPIFYCFQCQWLVQCSFLFWPAGGSCGLLGSVGGCNQRMVWHYACGIVWGTMSNLCSLVELENAFEQQTHPCGCQQCTTACLKSGAFLFLRTALKKCCSNFLNITHVLRMCRFWGSKNEAEDRTLWLTK
jgi:hypothetical protein